ncbi:MAG: helix-turn-helix domain-containing protein [Patescibacteria group bacterium]
MKYIQELQNIGLNKKQAETYLACLKLGSSSVKPIAELANLPRTTTYTILEELYKKGFINRLIKKNIRYYCVGDPKNLIQKVKEGITNAEKIIPDLSNLFMNAKVLPETKLYQGENSIINAWEEILQDGIRYKNLRVITNLQPSESLKKYFPKFRKKRQQLKIFSKILLTNTLKSKQFVDNDNAVYQSSKLLPKDYNFNVSIIIVGNKIFFFSLKDEHTAVCIQNKQIVETIATLYDLIWTFC